VTFATCLLRRMLAKRSAFPWNEHYVLPQLLSEYFTTFTFLFRFAALKRKDAVSPLFASVIEQVGM
jgi:hypothetical protein